MPFYAVSKRRIQVAQYKGASFEPKNIYSQEDFENILMPNESLLIFETLAEAQTVMLMMSPEVGIEEQKKSSVKRYFSAVIFEFASDVDETIAPEIISAEIIATKYDEREKVIYSGLLTAYYLHEKMQHPKPVEMPACRRYPPYGTIINAHFNGADGIVYEFPLAIDRHEPAKKRGPKL